MLQPYAHELDELELRKHCCTSREKDQILEKTLETLRLHNALSEAQTTRNEIHLNIFDYLHTDKPKTMNLKVSTSLLSSFVISCILQSGYVEFSLKASLLSVFRLIRSLAEHSAAELNRNERTRVNVAKGIESSDGEAYEIKTREGECYVMMVKSVVKACMLPSLFELIPG